MKIFFKKKIKVPTQINLFDFDAFDPLNRVFAHQKAIACGKWAKLDCTGELVNLKKHTKQWKSLIKVYPWVKELTYEFEELPWKKNILID